MRSRPARTSTATIRRHLRRTDANTPASYNKTVTDANYQTFLSQLLREDGTWTGRTSNGVGPAQITYWAFHRTPARPEPPTRRTTCSRSAAVPQYLGGDYSEASVKLAATRYNAGPAATTPNAYGQKVWTGVAKYKAAFARRRTRRTTPTPPSEPTIPSLPGVEVTEDPGPLPELDTELVSVTLPEPPKAEVSRPARRTRLRAAGRRLRPARPRVVPPPVVDSAGGGYRASWRSLARTSRRRVPRSRRRPAPWFLPALSGCPGRVGRLRRTRRCRGSR